jgi:hypothetical protein
MSEPKRWLDQGAPRDIEELVRAARAEQPSDGSLRRTLSAIGVGVGATTVVGSAAGSAGMATSAGTAKVAASITAGVIAKWTALGATVGTLCVGATTIVTSAPREAEAPVVSSARSSTRPRPAPSRPAPVLPAQSPKPPAPAELAEPVATATALADRQTPMPVPSEAQRRAAPVTAAGPYDPPPTRVPRGTETLSQEVQSVDSARAALAAGNPIQTLRLLDEYERRFPARGFAPEALYLRMEALSLLGRTAEARAVAERLLVSYPNTPQSARARVVFSKNP